MALRKNNFITIKNFFFFFCAVLSPSQMTVSSVALDITMFMIVALFFSRLFLYTTNKGVLHWECLVTVNKQLPCAYDVVYAIRTDPYKVKGQASAIYAYKWSVSDINITTVTPLLKCCSHMAVIGRVYFQQVVHRTISFFFPLFSAPRLLSVAKPTSTLWKNSEVTKVIFQPEDSFVRNLISIANVRQLHRLQSSRALRPIGPNRLVHLECFTRLTSWAQRLIEERWSLQGGINTRTSATEHIFISLVPI